MNEAELREQMCLVGQLMHRNGYVDGAGGNISVKLDETHLLTTPSGLAKGFMSPDEMVIVDITGNRSEPLDKTPFNLRPTSELVMHLECYHQRPDIQAVVHAHPPTAVALTISGHNLSNILIPEIVILMGTIPTLPYATPASDENRTAIGEAIRGHDALMLAYHGSLTVAKSLWDAYLRLENLEHSAKMIYMVNQLGGANTFISGEQLERLIEIRQRLGLLRPNDRDQIMQLSQH